MNGPNTQSALGVATNKRFIWWPAATGIIAMRSLRPRMFWKTVNKGLLTFGFARLAVLAILDIQTSSALATDIEPRAYSNIPVGVNFLLAGYGYTHGNVTFASSVPIENGKMDIHSTVLAYVRSLDLWGKSGKIDIIIPEAWLSGQADVLGKPRNREISGFADPIFRLYVNLFGAPTLSMKEFARYSKTLLSAPVLRSLRPAANTTPRN
jgi:hypothetical protein